MTDPRTFIVAETLRDGTAVSIRAIRPDDKRRVFEAFANLDRKSVFTRFFNYKTSANLCGKAQYRVGYNGRAASLASAVSKPDATVAHT